MIRIEKPLLILFLLFTLVVNAQEDITVSDLQRDLLKSKNVGKENYYVYYYPTEFWRISFQNNPTVGEETINYLESVFSDYILIMAGKISIDVREEDAIETENLSTLSKNVSLIDNSGKVYKPLKADEMSPEVLQMMEAMQPALGTVLGKMGKGMKLFLFKVKDKAGHNAINAKQNTPFFIKFYGQEFKYDLPLSAYVPKKTCPVDKEQLNGKWNYCPMHGEKLED